LAIGKTGAALLKQGARVMTYCNAGALATGGYGTALGVFRAAKSEGKRIHVLVNETRPLFQGSRLTAYELQNDDIEFSLICDNSAGLLMSRKMVDAVIVGADRIASNGDTANKIGTYALAVLAQLHGIPFYVAAPSSTFDLAIFTGADIPLEQRAEIEVTHLQGRQFAPTGARAYNFAFDVTPNKFIHAFITEKGLLKPPFQDSIQNTLNNLL
jgi:methylthioribose-1-phosphate isomerase